MQQINSRERDYGERPMNIQHQIGLLIGVGLALSLSLGHAAEKEDSIPGLKPHLVIKMAKEGEDKSAACMYFSPDSKILASASGKHLRLWDVKTGKLLRETTVKYDPEGNGILREGNVTLYGFLNGGRLIACSAGTGTQIDWLDVDTLKVKQTLLPERRSNPFRIGAASPDGKLFVAEQEDHVVRAWESESGKEIWERDFQSVSLSYLSFSADSKQLLATEDPHRTFRVLDAKNAKDLYLLDNLRGSRRPLGETKPVFSPNGKFILAGVGRTNELCLVEARERGQSRLFTWEKPLPTNPDKKLDLSTNSHASIVGFSHDGQTLFAVCDDRRLRFFEVSTGEMWLDVERRFFKCALSPDGKLFSTGRGDLGEIHLWDWHKSFCAPSTKVGDDTAKKLWQDLQSRDAKVGRKAMSHLLADPKQLLLQAKTLSRVLPTSEEELKQLIKDLSADTFRVRQEAENRLAELGKVALPTLRQALEKPGSKQAEVSLRSLIEQADTLSANDLRALRCIEMLERLGTDEAQEMLKGLATGVPGALITTQATDSLQRLK